MNLTDRKRQILEAVILLHTNTGDPVGSKILNEYLSAVSVSSATLRNEMSELTAMGLLEQPHVSAGRIPTSYGMRFYVDHLMSYLPMSESEILHMNRIIGTMDSDPARMAEDSVKELSELSGLAALAISPCGGETKIIHFDVIRVGRYNLAILGVTDNGSVLTRVCRINSELNEARLSDVQKALILGLAFVSPEDVTPNKLSALRELLRKDGFDPIPIVEAAAALLRVCREVRVFSCGQQNLLRYRELDPCMKNLLEFFSDRESIRARLYHPQTALKISVGDETELEGLNAIGMVTARYRAPGGRFGGIGIVGPARMNYALIVPRLRFFADAMSAALTG